MTRPLDPRRGPIFPATILLLLALLAPGWAFAAKTRVDAAGAGGYRGVLEFAAAPLETMRPTPFTLALFDPAGQPTTTPELSCELVMPAMPMPENRPRLVAEGDRYRSEAIFTMAGAWQVRVTVNQGGATVSRLNFNLERVLLK